MKHIEAPFQDALKEYLFFFPHAGASVEAYQHWVPYFNSHIICQSIPLPGRGRRFLEPFCESLEDLIHDLIPLMFPFDDKPINIFGHSMGALIAFELSRQLLFNHQIRVKRLFLSGHRAPRVPSNNRYLHTLPPKELFIRLKKMGGFLEKPETNLLELEPFFPIIYNDLRISELYQYTPMPPLPIDLILFWSDNDDFIKKHSVNLWQQESTKPLLSYKFSGGHFYLKNHYLEVINIINTIIG